MSVHNSFGANTNNTSELIGLAQTLALRKTKRKRRFDLSSMQLQTTKKQISTAYKQLLAQRAHLPTCSDPLLENHYTVDKALSEVCDTVKFNSFRGMPAITEGNLRGTMRIYLLCDELLKSNNYSIDMQNLRLFINAFQEKSALENSELSLLALMLKTSCIKQAASIYLSVENIVKEYIYATETFNSICLSTGQKRVEILMEQAVNRLSCSGITSLYTLLSENDDFTHIALLNQKLEEQSRDTLKEAESDRSLQLSLSSLAVNIVNTLRFAGSLDTETIVNEFSMLSHALERDEIYNLCDNATKSGYSSACDDIAKKLSISPVAVAKYAKDCVGDESIAQLLFTDAGRAKLIRFMGKNAKAPTKSLRLLTFIAMQLFFALAILLLTDGKISSLAFSFFPALIIADSLSIWLFCQIRKPTVIPRLNIKKVQPAKTAVTVCALITDEKALKDVIVRMETHYLANRNCGSIFVVLGDFPDNKTENMSENEEKLLTLAANEIAALNKKYADNEAIFYYLHRKREFNAADSLYMGKERKRGAIMQLFEYLTSGADKKAALKEKYSVFTDELPSDIRYAVLLDSDTVLPKDTLGQLIGAAMHPQNRAVVEGAKVVSGYGILIPRIESLLAVNTEYGKLQSGFCGVVPYSSLICDFYQDNFSSAIFGGKGIIDINAFFECVSGKIRDNTVLSHDLLESCFVRAGYLSDVILYDSEPQTVISWWKRRHRWIRGDWQLIPYIFESAKTGISALSKYKILDNLRRSLFHIAVFASIAAIPFFGRKIAFWGIVAFFIDFIKDTIIKAVCAIKSGKFQSREQIRNSQKAIVDFICLPYAAHMSFDAIVRTLYRVTVSHRNMLQWQTAAQSAGIKGSYMFYCRKMWLCLLAGTVLLLCPLWGMHGSVILGVLFLYAPFAMKLLDTASEKEKLPENIFCEFSALAHDIWRFFDECSSAEYGFIPPDNIQKDPPMPPVFNTSPTNIGMGLMASVCAKDLGFIDESTMAKRLITTFEYINSFEKWNGHLYNWYNIKTKQKLNPAYVSTVDSGNLCACLLYAAQALIETDVSENIKYAQAMRKMVYDMDFSPLFDESKKLFYIGFDITACSVTQARYDLLASEARLTYMVAAALDKIPAKSWFLLGRILARAGESRSLISWSGTMFEYLMPMIFTSQIRDTLLDETCKAAVEEHIQYANAKGLPWGISESGYFAFDRSMYYQYRAFGAKNLGLSPMYAHENVVAPYACILAAMVYPNSAYENLKRFSRLGARGEYGYYEAVDFTCDRVQSGRECEIVKSFMAHHQGMSLCALNNVLSSDIIKKRFESIPEIRTVLIFNQEKLPNSALVLKKYERAMIRDEDMQSRTQQKPRIYKEQRRYPNAKVLTNGNFSSFISDSANSYIKLDDIYITRFRRDSLRLRYGVELFIKDGDKVYGISPANLCDAPCSTEYSYELHKAQTSIKTDTLLVKTETIVLQGINAQCIKISIANHSNVNKMLELGAFAQISLATYRDDIAHPAFVKLTVDAFVDDGVLYFRRRPTKNRGSIYAYTFFTGNGNTKYCCDESVSVGRHSSAFDAMHSPLSYNNRTKSPIEPALCCRKEFTLEGGESTELLFVIGADYTFNKAKSDVGVCKELDFAAFASRSFAMEMSALHFLRISPAKASTFDRIITRILLDIKSKKRDLKPAPLLYDGLYRFSISGELPIVTVEINSPTQYRLLKACLCLLQYSLYKGIAFDLAIIGEYTLSYRSDVKSYINELISTFMLGLRENAKERIHLIDRFDISEDEYALLMQSATVNIDSGRSLDKQFADEPLKQRNIPKLLPNTPQTETDSITDSLLAYNGYGGFDTVHDEYVIKLNAQKSTPLPWSNIICNPQNEGFGTLVTESAGGYTWKNNCHSNRLTPWYNDPMRDPQGEMILLRDEKGFLQSIAHSQMQGNGFVYVRHGFGYTVFENKSANARLTVFTDTCAPQKISVVELYNDSQKNKTLHLDYIIDWENGGGSITDFENGIATVYNTKNRDVFYSAVKNADSVSFSGDREGVLQFCAQKQDINHESFTCLSCAVNLGAYEKRKLILIMGMAQKEHIARNVNSVTVQSASEKLESIKAAWREKLEGLTVNVPDESFNLLVNKRLLYQVYASRLMGRTGYSQSGGAIGFRDQLQDTLALLYTDPQRTKGQILLCASMQYEKGDCMHWWHTPSTGVRTKISDDKLFLPLACIAYTSVTGDYSIYDVQTPYLEDKPIPDGKHDIYYTAAHSAKTGSVYEHCMRAIESSMNFGAHNLPLMGGGDWNDGMDNIGEGGGESVFLAFMLICIADGILPTVIKKRDYKMRDRLIELKRNLTETLEKSAWEGDRYKRAYYADKTPIGSRESDECKIDLLTQAWAVFANKHSENAKKALETAGKLLCDRENGIIPLLTPAFSDTGSHYAGYIESYIEGVRENGGQYTHAAMWYIIALCMVGEDEKAKEAFSMINPIEKSKAPDRYKGEPYAIAADVYTCDGAIGRAGWTWYSGSGAWAYITAVRYILGIVKRGNVLYIEPHNTWQSYDFTYRYGKAQYKVEVKRTGKKSATVDGHTVDKIELFDDADTHNVLITL